MRTTTLTPPVLYFGTPVALVTTLSPDGSTNISPISSAWAIGGTYALGMSRSGHGTQNLERVGELVINLPDASLVDQVERIAPTTGARKIPPHKRARFRHEADKWALGGLTPCASELVGPLRVADCPVQMEARVTRLSPLDETSDILVVHAAVLRTHVHDDLVVPGTQHVSLERWRPMYYTFRHYYAQGAEVGTNFRAEQ